MNKNITVIRQINLQTVNIMTQYTFLKITKTAFNAKTVIKRYHKKQDKYSVFNTAKSYILSYKPKYKHGDTRD